MNRARLATVAASLLLAACGSSATPGVQGTPAQITVASADVQGTFPAAFTCDGENRAPRVTWSGVPSGARSFVVEMTDQDAGNGEFTHWLVYDIPAGTSGISGELAGGAAAGRNDFGRNGYGGPCPPKGSAPHHYTIAVYALDADPALAAGRSRTEVEDAIQAHVVATGTLEATYQRQ